MVGMTLPGSEIYEREVLEVQVKGKETVPIVTSLD
jgi:hypothetical protein